MKTLTELKNEGYFGIDASIEISLFEYGLLVKISDDKTYYDCIYGVVSDDGMNYDRFNCANISKEEIDQLPFDLNDRGLFFSYIGMSVNNWKIDTGYVGKLHTLLSYFGYENIFGTGYDSFEIENI